MISSTNSGRLSDGQTLTVRRGLLVLIQERSTHHSTLTTRGRNMPLISQGQLFQWGEQQALNAVFLKTQSPAAAPTYLALSTTAIGSLSSAETSMTGTTINEEAPATRHP